MTRMPNLEQRLARVEQVMEALSREVKVIRAELERTEPTSERRETSPIDTAPSEAARPQPPKHDRRIAATVRSLDFEGLLGRYGMLGIAVFAAVAAVGSFLNWAISHGYLKLGPAARVILGFGFAVAIGVWGVDLRKKERSFGSSLMGLALVIVLVVAYAAGPYFHLIPTLVAFLGAAAIAWGLAMFARLENDEPLWCVAFGGAAIAPFATSDGSGSFYALLIYGLVLLVFGCFGIGKRDWPVAWRVFYFAALLLALSSGRLAPHNGLVGILAVLALPLAVGATGVVPFASDSSKRATLRVLAILTVALSFEVAHQHYRNGLPLLMAMDRWILSGAVLLMLALWLVIIDGSAEVAQSSILPRNTSAISFLHWFDAALIPLLLTFRAGEITSRSSMAVVAYSVGAMVLLAFTWRRSVGAARDAGAFAFMLTTVALILRAPLGPNTTLQIILLLGLALAALGLHRGRPSWSWVWTGAAVLALAIGLNVEFLTDRPRYALPPFGTAASFAALCIIVSLAIIARFWRWVHDACREALGDRPRRRYANILRGALKVIVAAPWVWAFWWIYLELSMAYSASTATLLLVTYFAMTAVCAVAVGRMRRSALLRRFGLALAIIAAATAVYGASTYFDSGIRVIAYLVTSAFLLGIAFWYRRTGASTAEA